MTARVSLTSRTMVKAGFLALFFVAGALLLGRISDLLLIIFFGVLLAILLDAAGRQILKVLPVTRSVAIISTALATITILALGLTLAGPSLVAQGVELGSDIADFAKSAERWAMSIDEVEEQVEKGSVDVLKLLPSPSGLLGGVTAVLGTTLGAVANVVLILAFGIYFALDPETYMSGTIRLLPVRHRDRARNVLNEMGTTLRHWLAGKALMMLLIGVTTYIALTLIGVPLALLLAVIAGATSFIPIVGPAIAGGLMVLVALSVGVQTAAWTIGFYIALQTAESYLLMPLIQSNAIGLPAGAVIAAQVLFGVLFGALGVTLATPIAAVTAVAIKRLYIEDVLDDEEAGAMTAEVGQFQTTST